MSHQDRYSLPPTHSLLLQTNKETGNAGTGGSREMVPPLMISKCPLRGCGEGFLDSEPTIDHCKLNCVLGIHILGLNPGLESLFCAQGGEG